MDQATAIKKQRTPTPGELRKKRKAELHPDMAERKRKSEFAGAGAVVQLVGFILLFFFPIGTIAGVFLLVIGHNMSRTWSCSACGNKLDSDKVMTCPTCHSSFD